MIAARPTMSEPLGIIVAAEAAKAAVSCLSDKGGVFSKGEGPWMKSLYRFAVSSEGEHSIEVYYRFLAGAGAKLPAWEDRTVDVELGLGVFVAAALTVADIRADQETAYDETRATVAEEQRQAHRRKAIASRKKQHADKHAARPAAVREMLAQRERNLRAEAAVKHAPELEPAAASPHGKPAKGKK